MRGITSGGWVKSADGIECKLHIVAVQTEPGLEVFMASCTLFHDKSTRNRNIPRRRERTSNLVLQSQTSFPAAKRAKLGGPERKKKLSPIAPIPHISGAKNAEREMSPLSFLRPLTIRPLFTEIYIRSRTNWSSSLILCIPTACTVYRSIIPMQVSVGLGMRIIAGNRVVQLAGSIIIRSRSINDLKIFTEPEHVTEKCHQRFIQSRSSRKSDVWKLIESKCIYFEREKK